MHLYSVMGWCLGTCKHLKCCAPPGTRWSTVICLPSHLWVLFLVVLTSITSPSYGPCIYAYTQMHIVLSKSCLRFRLNSIDAESPPYPPADPAARTHLHIHTHAHTHPHTYTPTQRSRHTPERSSKLRSMRASNCPQKVIAPTIEMGRSEIGIHQASRT